MTITERYRAEVEREERIVQAMIEDTVRDKGVMPPNYWQPLHKAKMRLRAAQGVVEAVDD